MTTSSYQREAGDIGNAIALEHLNLRIEDQGIATIFYITGLGLTRDPYMMTGTQFMWVNAGRTQFHLMMGEAQVVSGHIGVVMPDLQALVRRLESVRSLLEGTRFKFAWQDDFVAVTCPWGNQFHCHAPAAHLGRPDLGLSYITFDVAPGSAPGIAAFYQQIIEARTRIERAAPSVTAIVSIGFDQQLRFRETAAPIAPFDGHHIQIYVANFSSPHRKLVERELVTEESNEHQYRFDTIVDPANGQPLARIEHEVRSLRHPLYGRPLVNRNPEQTTAHYAWGQDAWVPGVALRHSSDFS